MKKTSLLFLSAFVFIAVFAIGSYLFWNNAQKPVNPQSEKTEIFVIPKGWDLEKISQELKKENLIKNKVVFQLISQFENLDTKLQAGDFRLSPSMSSKEILKELTHGSIDVWVTIPEGKRKEEIAAIIQNSFQEHGLDFAVQAFLDKTATMEGFLFPDTYLVPQKASADQVINILKSNFDKKYNNLNPKTFLSKEQTVILASLIEREAKFDKDRYRVGGVLLKRLKNGWPLQVDATVQYVKASRKCKQQLDCNWWPSNLTQNDIDMDSDYNTYKQKGLPPKPICNPGYASLKAAANPEDTEYWYYLSEPSGETHYSKTLEEHNQNIVKYLSN